MTRYSVSTARLCVSDGRLDLAMLNYVVVLKMQPAMACRLKGEVLRAFKLYCSRSRGSPVDRERTESLLGALRKFYGKCVEFMEICAHYFLSVEDCDSAVMYFNNVLQLDSNNLSARLALQDLRSHYMERWHFLMLNDVQRNRSYEMAIGRVVAERSVRSLLDIGCGSGILSMVACVYGVRNVTGCECNPMMAHIAEEIIRDNGMENSIRVIDKPSWDLQIVTDLHEKVDVIVTEIMDAGFYGESIASTLLDAKARLLKDDGIIIPSKGEVWGYLVQSDRIRRTHVIEPGSLPAAVRVPQVILSSTCAFKEAMLQDAWPIEPYTSERMRNIDHFFLQLSEPFLVDSIDLNSLNDLQAHCSYLEREVKVTLSRPGRVDAVVCWFKADLYEGIEVSSKPLNGGSPSWEQAVFPVYTTEVLPSGSELTIQCSMRDNMLSCSLQLDNVDPLEHAIYPPNLVQLMGDTALLNAYERFMSGMQDVNSILDLTGNPLLGHMAARMFKSQVWVHSANAASSLCHERLESIRCSDDAPPVHLFQNAEEVDDCQSGFDLLICCPISSGGELRRGALDDVLLYRYCQDIRRVLPDRVEVHCLLIDSLELEECTHVLDGQRTLGFKISRHMDPYSTVVQREIKLNHLAHRKLSAEFKAMTLDLNEPLAADDDHLPNFVRQTSNNVVSVVADGRLNAVVFWFVLSSSSVYDVHFSTADPSNHYHLAAHMISPFQVNAGTVIRVKTDLHNGVLIFDAAQ